MKRDYCESAEIAITVCTKDGFQAPWFYNGD